MNAVERKPVPTRVLNPNASEASYKPKQRSYRKTKLNFSFLIFFFYNIFPNFQKQFFALDAIASALYYHNTGRIIIIQHPCIINIYDNIKIYDCTGTVIYDGYDIKIWKPVNIN